MCFLTYKSPVKQIRRWPTERHILTPVFRPMPTLVPGNPGPYFNCRLIALALHLLITAQLESQRLTQWLAVKFTYINNCCIDLYWCKQPSMSLPKLSFSAKRQLRNNLQLITTKTHHPQTLNFSQQPTASSIHSTAIHPTQTKLPLPNTAPTYSNYITYNI